MGNTFETFSDLPDELQLEALREGEMLLQAQLTVATAADQRALTWGGLLLTGASATLGGAFAMLFKKAPDMGLIYLAVLFAAALFIAAWLAISTVAPRLYCMPGNYPDSWLPEHWDCVGDAKSKLQQARRDQAAQLDKFIRENAASAKTRAKRMHGSFGFAFFAVFAAWVCFLLYLTTGR